MLSQARILEIHDIRAFCGIYRFRCAFAGRPSQRRAEPTPMNKAKEPALCGRARRPESFFFLSFVLSCRIK